MISRNRVLVGLNGAVRSGPFKTSDLLGLDTPFEGLHQRPCAISPGTLGVPRMDGRVVPESAVASIGNILQRMGAAIEVQGGSVMIGKVASAAGDGALGSDERSITCCTNGATAKFSKVTKAPSVARDRTVPARRIYNDPKGPRLASSRSSRWCRGRRCALNQFHSTWPMAAETAYIIKELETVEMVEMMAFRLTETGRSGTRWLLALAMRDLSAVWREKFAPGCADNL